ncbi:MAG TPA: hypothetical protein VFX59_18075 [Polyangiales bacterium]|nr:hypothetical protein [Polyangiales bacterium]
MPFLFSSGCEGDNCGPTSEWPTCSQGSDTPSSFDDDDNSENGGGKDPPKDGSGTKRDAGKGSAPSLDAGVAPPLTPGEDFASDAGDAGTDSQVTSFDGGIESCTIDSDGRDAGACFGVYCDVAQRLCALQRCLAPCLSGASAECTSCRREQCGTAFSSCSGLPD